MVPAALAFRWSARLTPAQVRDRLDAGAACVRYEYVASLVLVTFRWESRVHLVERESSTYLRAVPYILFTCLFGWWALPWGVVDSAKAVWTNLGGGRDVTAEVEAALGEA